MFLARAASISFLTLGTLATQRGRTPQLPFMKSSTRSPVVAGSTVTGLSSGAAGIFTVAHSLVMSAAKAGSATSAAAATSAKQPECLAIWVMVFSLLWPARWKRAALCRFCRETTAAQDPWRQGRSKWIMHLSASAAVFYNLLTRTHELNILG